MTETQKAQYERSHWTIDRRVPLALIVVLLVQFGTGAWFMATLDSRTKNNTTRIEDLETGDQKQEDARFSIIGRVIRIEEKLSAQTELLKEIKTAVSRAN